MPPPDRLPRSAALQELEVDATLIVPIGTAARSDAGGNGEIHLYRSGSTIVLQAYSRDLGAWKSVALT
jgi:hypothetical protein